MAEKVIGEFHAYETILLTPDMRSYNLASNASGALEEREPELRLDKPTQIVRGKTYRMIQVDDETYRLEAKPEN